MKIRTKGTGKSRLKNYFYETFRPRGKDDYAKIFTRGLKDKEGVNADYPWFYMRVLALFLFVFALYAIIYCVLNDGTYSRTFFCVGGAFLDIALLVLLFELYPKNDFSLLSLLAIGFVGGAFATFISSFLYYFHSYETLKNGWKLAAVAGVGEEISKAVPAILCVVILKKKDNPLAGFMIGAAVGTWFSLTENAAYIANCGTRYQAILTALGRAVSAPFSHATWSAIICWAFCALKKPLINIKFYGIVLSCMILHFVCDIPLLYHFPLVFVLCAACLAEATITFGFAVYIFVKGRKKAFSTAPEKFIGLSEVAATDGAKPEFTRAHKANLTLVAAAALFCVLALILASVYLPYVYVQVFDDKDEFIRFAQNGMEISPDAERPFDVEATDNRYEIRENGELIYAEQTETVGEVTYIYCYGADEASEHEFILTSTDIMLQTEDGEQRFKPITYLFLDGDESESFTYYKINPDANGISIRRQNGKTTFSRYTRKLPWLSILMICLTCAEAVGGLTLYFVLKRKSK